MAHLWAKWLHHPCRLGGPHRFRAGGAYQKWPTCGQSGYVAPAVSGIPIASERGAKSEVAHLWAKWLRHPYRFGDPHRCRAGRGNQKWPTSGQSGYVTPAVSGISTALERGAKSEVVHFRAKWLRRPCRLGDPHRCRARGGGGSKVAHKWAKWLHHPCRLSDSHRFGAGGKIRSGQIVGKVATSRLPSRGSPPLQSGGGKSKVAHKWAKWLCHPCRLGDFHRFRAGGKIRSGPLLGKVAMSPCRLGDPHRCRAGGGGDQKWPTSGQSGYITPAFPRIPTASERGAKSEVAQLWAKWLHHACRVGAPHRFGAGGKIRSGPQVGKVAMSPLPSRGSPPLQSRGGGIISGPLLGKVATSPLPSRGSPPLQSRGGKSEVANKWAKWLCHPCRLGDFHRFRAGGKIRSGPLLGKVATSPLPSHGSPML